MSLQKVHCPVCGRLVQPRLRMRRLRGYFPNHGPLGNPCRTGGHDVDHVTKLDQANALVTLRPRHPFMARPGSYRRCWCGGHSGEKVHS